MRFPKYITVAESEQLDQELVSDALRINLTRTIMDFTNSSNDPYETMVRQNRVMNMSKTVSGGEIYVLDTEAGECVPEEFVYHGARVHLILRDLTTSEFIELVCEYIRSEDLDADYVNELLERDNLYFRFISDHESVSVEVLSTDDVIEDEGDSHVNIRVLVNRMKTCFEQNDYAGTLHASASVFETLAKDVVNNPNIQNQTLGGFFALYRNNSELPTPILDYVETIYQNRNTTPLAGHGSTAQHQVTRSEAIILLEMTKAFVQIEYKSRVSQATT
jgi:hypothetical protein